MRRYLGDSVADRLLDLPADEVASLKERAELSRAYLLADMAAAMRRG